MPSQNSTYPIPPTHISTFFFFICFVLQTYLSMNLIFPCRERVIHYHLQFDQPSMKQRGKTRHILYTEGKLLYTYIYNPSIIFLAKRTRKFATISLTIPSERETKEGRSKSSRKPQFSRTFRCISMI